MKNKIYLLSPVLVFLLLPGLSNSQTWNSIKNFQPNRDGAVSFSIGSYGFCGGGAEKQDDFWRYNPITNTWKQLANIPGVNQGRGFAVGVSIGKYGYVGFGQDSASQTAVQRDWWRYDTATNTWTQKASMPVVGYARDAAGVFAVNGKIYVFGGVDSSFEYLKDCWAYDTGTDSWTQMNALPDWIGFPSGFSINGKGYFACYVSGTNGLESKNTYMYDPMADTWTPEASFPGIAREAGTAFVLNNIAYVGLGQSQYDTIYRDFYSYNPVSNTWNSVGNYGGSQRAWPSAFAIGNKGYVGSGSYFVGNSVVLATDWWKFTPSALSIDEIKDANGFACYPVPANNFITIENTGSVNNSGDVNYYIYDMSGKLADAGQLMYDNNKAILNVSGLSNGEYIVCLKNNSTLIGSKKITVLR